MDFFCDHCEKKIRHTVSLSNGNKEFGKVSFCSRECLNEYYKINPERYKKDLEDIKRADEYGQCFLWVIGFILFLAFLFSDFFDKLPVNWREGINE
jgi:hypothetical protein